MSEKGNLPSHQKLFKKKSLLPWKETYRKRCLERLKNNRHNLLEKLRDIPKNIIHDDSYDSVMDVMAEEWHDIVREIQSNIGQIMFVDDDWEDERILLMQEIQQELLYEEQLILKEHNVNIEIEEDYIKRAVLEEVICPICQKCPLEHSFSVISCLCGFRIENEHSCLRLQDFKTKLFEGLNSHNKYCHSNPCFSTTNLGGATNLLISCPFCDFMHIVL